MNRANPFVTLFRRLWEYSEGNRSRVILYALLCMAANVIFLAEPFVIGHACDVLVATVSQARSGAPADFTPLYRALLFFPLVMAGFWAFHWPSRVIETDNAFRAAARYRDTLNAKLNDLPAQWHRDHHSGDTIDKIDKATRALGDFGERTFMIIERTIRLIGAIVILTYFDLVAAALTFTIAIGTIFVIARFDRRLHAGYRRILTFHNAVTQAMFDAISNMMTVISLRLKGPILREIHARGMAGRGEVRRNQSLTEAKWCFANIVIAFMMAAVLGLYAYRSYGLRGVVTLGAFVMLYRYLDSVGKIFHIFAEFYGEVVRYDAAIAAVGHIEEEHRKVAVLHHAPLPAGWKELRVTGLSFGYAIRDAETGVREAFSMRDLDLELRRGERIAFIGESGAGKSSILAVLRGLYSAEQAAVLCDGVPLPDGLGHLFETTTLIPQDPEIFNSTVENNITMDVHLDPVLLRRAIEIARFAPVVQELPNGLATSVMERGVSLSGGQKQRLALARGILAAEGSDIVLLDEPTSSVDAMNERLIYENIFQAFPDKAIVSCIHRLHLLPFFDTIYLFEQGKLVARGTLDELRHVPQFRALWEKYHQLSAAS